MPRLLRARSDKAKIYDRHGIDKRVEEAKVSLMWVPQTTGSPAVPGNAPQRYWPGSRYVDWVGADAYAKFSNSTGASSRRTSSTSASTPTRSASSAGT